jgi:hypothetical protein
LIHRFSPAKKESARTLAGTNFVRAMFGSINAANPLALAARLPPDLPRDAATGASALLRDAPTFTSDFSRGAACDAALFSSALRRLLR